MNHYGLIMAGGSGTRFWPLSRQKKPKQLLNLTGNEVMVNEAVERMATIIGKSNIFVITSELLTPDMTMATAGKVFPQNIFSEPVARNTAACIGYSAMEIIKKYGDGIMLITPADHYIKNSEALTEAFRQAIVTAEETDKLITIGIKPYAPSTAFGYIRYDKSTDEKVRHVFEFKEKPDASTALSYVDSGDYLWNSGMFIWKVSLILKKLKEYAPDIYYDLDKISKAMNTVDEQVVLHEVYPNIKKMSIDYAVMEASAVNNDVLVIPCECGWNDVGSWDSMGILHEEDENGNVLLGDVTEVDSKNSTLYSTKRKIAALGVNNIVVVETEDAVLVCDKKRIQDIRQIVDSLSGENRYELL